MELRLNVESRWLRWMFAALIVAASVGTTCQAEESSVFTGPMLGLDSRMDGDAALSVVELRIASAVQPRRTTISDAYLPQDSVVDRLAATIEVHSPQQRSLSVLKQAVTHAPVLIQQFFSPGQAGTQLDEAGSAPVTGAARYIARPNLYTMASR